MTFILLRDCDKSHEGNSHCSVAIRGEEEFSFRLVGRKCLSGEVFFRLTGEGEEVSRNVEREIIF